MQTMIPEARLTNPAFLLPGAMDALQSLGKVVRRAGVPAKTVELIALRASQINGCGVCALQYPKILRKLGETDDRIFAVAVWRVARNPQLAVLAIAMLYVVARSVIARAFQE